MTIGSRYTPIFNKNFIDSVKEQNPSLVLTCVRLVVVEELSAPHLIPVQARHRFVHDALQDSIRSAEQRQKLSGARLH